MKSEDDVDNQCSRSDPQRFEKQTEGTGNHRKNRDHIIIKISQDAQESPGDLKIFAGTQTSVKNHQSELALKIHIE